MPAAYYNGKPLGGAGGIHVNGIISREDFDALPVEKRNRGVWFIQDAGQPLQGATIEEYDTTVDGCDWHVRKWSNGYVEMFGVSHPITISGSDFKEWNGSGIYTRSNPTHKLPVVLISKYFEQVYASIENSTTTFILDTLDNSLNQTRNSVLARGGQISGDIKSVSFRYSITGRWKDNDSGTLAASSEPQYDIDIPEHTTIASDAEVME